MSLILPDVINDTTLALGGLQVNLNSSAIAVVNRIGAQFLLTVQSTVYAITDRSVVPTLTLWAKY